MVNLSRCRCKAHCVASHYLVKGVSEVSWVVGGERGRLQYGLGKPNRMQGKRRGFGLKIHRIQRKKYNRWQGKRDYQKTRCEGFFSGERDAQKGGKVRGRGKEI